MFVRPPPPPFLHCTCCLAAMVPSCYGAQLLGHVAASSACLTAGRRPALLLQEEFQAAPAARAELQRLFPEADVDRMVEGQPLLLVEDVGEAISELQRCPPPPPPQTDHSAVTCRTHEPGHISAPSARLLGLAPHDGASLQVCYTCLHEFVGGGGGGKL